MRMMLEVQMPHEPFNTLLRQGTAGKTLAEILDQLKPEAVYFTERDGKRGAVIVLNVEEPSRIPSIVEPFFLSFNADCRFHIAMSAQDLRNSGLEELAKRWG
jgi:hypothetical protein